MFINDQGFEYAISSIGEGRIFEKFGQSFLNGVIGIDFIPVGQSKDKGIDGYQHLFCNTKNIKKIYQFSTEKDYEGKIKLTINILKKNKIEFDKLFYVTNRKLNNTYYYIDYIYDNYGIVLEIWDIRWFSSNRHSNQQTTNAYDHFVNTYLHEFTRPGINTAVADLNDDSRLYVFLQQQFENDDSGRELDDLLADTLILYSLEETDPSTENVMTEDEIIVKIQKYLKFDMKLISSKIEQRLQHLSRKPRKIQYHRKFNGYCLPYETRLEISNRNLEDAALVEVFTQQSMDIIRKYVKEQDINVKNISNLITDIFCHIYKRQGLEFSNFILHGDSQSVFEQNLNEIIESTVDKSTIILKNHQSVKTALFLSIREIVYNGSKEQMRFLKSLSNTYMLMFTLQWEPRITIYFRSLASKMEVFVDNSIIIPALSEYFLSESNRRHWNLLLGAHKAGIKLFINDSLLDELVAHFKMVQSKYINLYKSQDEYYSSNEDAILYIDDIMLRSYFYAKKRRLVSSFKSYLENFLDSSLQGSKSDLIIYLKTIFGIEHISNESLNINIDNKEAEALCGNLKLHKGNEQKAVNDAIMILTIYKLREKRNETANSGIFGYKTWWLSKDTSTYKAVQETFGDKYNVSCYLRADFVYNYIALSPSQEEVNEAYDVIFPTMLGVNLSYHMSREVSLAVQKKIAEYHSLPNVRVQQIIQRSIERLKSEPSINSQFQVFKIFEEELKRDETK